MFTLAHDSKISTLLSILCIGLLAACENSINSESVAQGSSQTSTKDPSTINELCLPNAIWCGVTGGLTAYPALSNSDIVSFYSDADNGGSSVITLPVSDTVPNYIDSTIQQSGGIFFGFTLNNGLWRYAPYVGTQINISGWSNEATEITEDITDWEGICVRYYSTSDIYMKLGLPALTEEAINYYNYYALLPATYPLATACIDWSSFTTPHTEFVEQTISLVDAIKNVTRIKFQIEHGEGIVNIASISKYADGLNAQDLILPAASSSSVNFVVTQPDSSYWDEISQDEWCGPCGDNRITTGYDNGNDGSGWWYTYSENNTQKKDNSTIIWPVAIGTAYDENSMDPVIDYCKGLCGKYTLGENCENPYVGVAFNIADYNLINDNTADISDQSGLCIAYESTTDMRLKVVPSDSLEGNIPFATLNKSSEGSTTCVSFDEFDQYAGQGDSISIEDVLKEAKAIAIEFYGSAGDTGTFNIRTFGWKE